MSLVPVKYPLDRTGQAATNLVADELHQLNNANYRVLVPRYGAFFTESLSLREAATGKPLVNGVDYYPAMLYKTPTMDTGKEIHQIVVITNPNVSANVYFNAQMLGGEYSYSWDAIVQLIESLKLDQRSVLFENIIGKPDNYPPTPHLHDIGDVFGFEFQVAGMERIRQAIMLGGGAQLRSIFQYIDNQITEVNNKFDAQLSTQNTPQAIIDALGYPPVNKEGDSFDGPMLFRAGMTNRGFYKEIIKRLTATTAQTTLDLSLAGIFQVTLSSSTTFKFDVSHIPDIQADESISFTLVIKNDGTAGRAVAFGSNVMWADQTVPPRSTSANAQDEYYFSTFDGGLTWTGSLSNANVGQSS